MSRITLKEAPLFYVFETSAFSRLVRQNKNQGMNLYGAIWEKCPGAALLEGGLISKKYYGSHLFSVHQRRWFLVYVAVPGFPPQS